MKKLILITLSLSFLALHANELAWVDQQIEAIKPPRSGLKTSTLSSIDDPFIFLKKNKPKTKKKASNKNNVTAKGNKKAKNTLNAKKKFTLSLNAVMNKSALINGKWYKVGDKVYGYKLSEVKPKSVILRKKNKKLILSTKSVSKNLKFKNN